jgi:archaellum biogenesis ATPase FlaH
MTQFTKENLVIGSDTIHYDNGTGQLQFVARFKYGRSSKGPFATFLKKNFTVEEYFSRMTSGEHPLPILQSKGFIQTHVKQWLKQANLPVTQEGYEIFKARQFKGV